MCIIESKLHNYGLKLTFHAGINFVLVTQGYINTTYLAVQHVLLECSLLLHVSSMEWNSDCKHAQVYKM